MIEQLVARAFAMRDYAHLKHWATKSYSEHKALGKFYEGLIDKVDGIIEAYQGVFGLIGKVELAVFPQGDIAEQIDGELKWLEENREKLANGSTLIENLLDDLMQLYASTRYKLVNLS